MDAVSCQRWGWVSATQTPHSDMPPHTTLFVPVPGHVPLLLSHCGPSGVPILPEWSSGGGAEPPSLSPRPPALSTCFSPVQLEGWG